LHQIIRGTTQTAEFEIYVNGQLANADGNVHVSATDADFGVVVGTGGIAYNDPQLGKYTFDLDSSYTTLNRVLRLQWDYTVNGKAVSSEDFYEVYTPYASVSSIIKYYNFGTRPQDLDYKSQEEIAAAERIARYQIDNYTSQTFGRASGDQEVFGYDSDAIELTQRMVNINQMYENGILVINNSQNPPVNTFGYQIELTPTNRAVRIIKNSQDVIYEGQYDPTILYYGRFREHTRYRFYGEIGWTYVPQDISWCAMKLAGNILSRDSEWRQRYLKKVDLSEISFELAAGAFNGTGDVIVDSILDSYRNTGIVVI
jgi:hypothetical protein